jgi:hypothetical protein
MLVLLEAISDFHSPSNLLFPKGPDLSGYEKRGQGDLQKVSILFQEC